MAKIFSIHMLALKQEIQEEDFERFVKVEWNPQFVPPPGFSGPARPSKPALIRSGSTITSSSTSTGNPGKACGKPGP